MNSRRPAPQYHPPKIFPRAQLEPGGDHRLLIEIESGLVIADYDARQVDQLEEAIAQFRRLAVTADGGRDFHNRKFIPIEVSR